MIPKIRANSTMKLCSPTKNTDFTFPKGLKLTDAINDLLCMLDTSEFTVIKSRMDEIILIRSSAK